MQPQLPQNSGQLDSSVLNLMSGIRQVESGGNYAAKGQSGETGAYQFMPSTWKGWAGQYLGDPNADINDPANQNKVAYARIADRKAAGLNPTQIVSEWNSGKTDPTGNVGVNSQGVAYDTPGYVNKVLTAAQQFAQSRQQTAGGNGIIPTANVSDGQTPAVNQGPTASGFVQNVGSSAMNLLGGLGSMVAHPVDTLSNVAGIISGGGQRLGNAIGLGNGSDEDAQKFDAMVGYMKQRYGGSSVHEVLGNIGNTFYTDPVGAALDLSTLIDGVGGMAGAAGKVSQISELTNAAKTLKTVAQSINPIAGAAKVAGGVASKVGDIAKFGAAQGIGLNKAEDVSTIINNYNKMDGVTRGSVAEDVGTGIKELKNATGENSAGYNKYKTMNTLVSQPENFIENILTRGFDSENPKAIPFGLKIERDINTGELKVSADTNSFTRNPSDIAAIQNFVDRWGNKLEMTPNEFMQMRSDAGKLGRSDLGPLAKNDAAELVGRDIRAKMNETMRPQIKGFKQTDEINAPDAELWKKVSKDLLIEGPNGYEFKPGALNKIANATGKGKDIFLQRLEHIRPGITERIKILKTVESIESAFDIKTGTYIKGIIGGSALLTGNVPAVIAAIVSHPSIAVPLLKGLGWSKAKIAPILEFMRQYANSGTARYGLEANRSASNSSPQ